MEFDKPDKEVQRPRGNDVADQACSRSCGWRGELREPSAVAAAASTAEEHATTRESLHAARVPPQKCLKWQLHIRVSSTALQVYHARRAAELASLLRLRFGLAVPA